MRLNDNQLGQEGKKQQTKHKSQYKGHVKCNLSHKWVFVDNDWQNASFLGQIERCLGDVDIKVEEGHQNDENHVEFLQPNEQIEVAVIVYANAIVDPLAVVVIPFNALPANVAVARIGRADDLTRWTQHIWVKFLHKSQKWYVRTSSHVTWLSARSQSEKDERA